MPSRIDPADLMLSTWPCTLIPGFRTEPMAPSSRLPVIFVVATVTLDTIGKGLIFPVLPRQIEKATGRPRPPRPPVGRYPDQFRGAMQFLFDPPLGALADRYGRRPVLPLARRSCSSRPF